MSWGIVFGVLIFTLVCTAVTHFFAMKSSKKSN